jgi:hypothetical protein
MRTPPRVIVLGLFLDGALVELVDDPLDVLGYLPRLGGLPGLAQDPGPSCRRRGRAATHVVRALLFAASLSARR